MRFGKRMQLGLVCMCMSVLLCGWGGTGHRKISGNALSFLPAEMKDFRQWSDYITSHASDPDYRKGDNDDEAPKHFIDIDNYYEFQRTGQIDTSFDAMVKKHGYNFVIDQGILPWAILRTYDSLKSNIGKRNWDRSKYFAADLGHYIADAFMPLHLTVNYNGYNTGQSGVHSRYETKMVDAYQNYIIIRDSAATDIDNVTASVFNMIYRNYRYVDSVLAADKKASAEAGNTNTDSYYKKLWTYSGGFTNRLFSGASVTLASYIYSAWVEAGKPAYSVTAVEEEKTAGRYGFSVEQNYPNPFNPATIISYSVPEECRVTIKLFDITGRQLAVLLDETRPYGKHEYSLNMDSYPDLGSGVYFYSFTAAGYAKAGKLMFIK